MLFTPEEIQQLFFIVDYRIARVIADVLGKEYLSQEDIDMLKRFDFDLKTEVLKIPPYWQAFQSKRLNAKNVKYAKKRKNINVKKSH